MPQGKPVTFTESARLGNMVEVDVIDHDQGQVVTVRPKEFNVGGDIDR